jgi:threonylcarbamoyladenosine tRNA methylthiotransferase MtaB
MSEPRIITFGCRLNAFESEVMRGHAQAAGLGEAVIVNTCSVTAEAVRQARQAIRKARRERPDAQIIVTGCAAQTEPETFAAMPEVDRIIGNAEKLEPGSYRALLEPETERVQVDDIMSVRETAGHLVDGFGGRARAYVQVQNGCDHRCTFCIIPYGRGPSRSVPAGVVVEQVRRLVEGGTREIVLTGVDMTAYGRDLPGGMTLGKLVQRILKLVPELPRLRLSSIDSIEADAALLAALAEEERLMPHLHLSVQAGHDLTLKRMKRRHSRADTIGFCAHARRLRPDIVLGADLIAGFPTETEEMFAGTLLLPEDAGLTYLHVFPYSPRKGTPAARMPQVERGVAKERAARLRAVGERRLSAYLGSLEGREVDGLVEEAGTARTPQFAEVLIEGSARPGEIRRMRVTGHDGHRLSGALS